MILARKPLASQKIANSSSSGTENGFVSWAFDTYHITQKFSQSYPNGAVAIYMLDCTITNLPLVKCNVTYYLGFFQNAAK